MFRCFSFTNVLCEADANAVKTDALELDECFLCSDGRRGNASIAIGSHENSTSTTNVQK
jgi:hypothetical protein